LAVHRTNPLLGDHLFAETDGHRAGQTRRIEGKANPRRPSHQSYNRRSDVSPLQASYL
jgi:hypothetical protein